MGRGVPGHERHPLGYRPTVVLAVVPGSPAAKVLRAGDRLVSVSGPPPRDRSLLGPSVVDQIDAQLPGTPLALTIQRGGSEQVVHLALSSYADPAVPLGTEPQPGYLGADLNPQPGSDVQGAYLASVAPGGPAERSGLGAGDVVTSFGSDRIHSAQDLLTALLAARAGFSVPVTVVTSAGSTMTMTVALGPWPSDVYGPVPPTVLPI